MTDDKFLLLEMHPCTRGLSDEAVMEIADATELVRFNSGDTVHRASDVVTAVDLVVHGRLRLSVMDSHGKVLLQRSRTSGGQYGGLSAALGEPSGVECVAEDPTTILRLEYRAALDLTAKHEVFRLNMMKLLADGLQHTLLQQKHRTKPHLVAIFHQSSESRGLSRKLIQRLKELGEKPCLLTDDPKWDPIEGVRYRQMVEGGRRRSEEENRRQIHEWADATRVLFDVETSWDPVHATAVLDACELALWCVTPQNWRESLPYLEAIETQSPTWREKVCIVWLLDREQLSPLASPLRKFANRDIKISFATPAPNRGGVMNHGFERLIHLLRDIQIGVALGGGAARGMAHLGVLKAFEQSGIVVDMISGTSAGAMTGIVYASGLEVDYAIERFVADLRPSWFFRLLPRGDHWWLLYKYRRGHFEPMLRKYLQQYQLEQLAVPMSSITVDLVSGKAMVRDAGDAVHAIVESINLPGLSLPIIREGQALVDGGMVNNVPADVLVAKGCNFVIAASVSAKIETEFASNRRDTPVSEMKPASTMQTLLRTYLVQSANLNALGVQPADVVIEPDVTGFGLSEFVRTDELAAVGEQTTLEAMSGIKESLVRLDPQLFASLQQ